MASSILEQIREDHNEMRSMARELMEMPLDKVEARKQRFEAFKQKVLAHSKAEEHVFYARIQKDTPQDGELKDEMVHGKKEHEEAEAMLKKLEAMNPADESFNGMFLKLHEALEHHMQEEENEVLREAGESYSEESLAEMDTQMREEKRQLAGSRT